MPEDGIDGSCKINLVFNKPLFDSQTRSIEACHPRLFILPKRHLTEEVEHNFCEGIIDKKAGKHALNSVAKVAGSCDECNEHISNAMDRRKRKKQNKEDSVNEMQESASGKQLCFN
ncbi:hypothetical protein MAR_035179 [Mya arenaria]|uniref:Uncharacterized protein n=1 Tax=Mya arenaria TaxID=6604 RepID=A0ABY7ENA2_MYAAR|nr:hypothetical protein MAR_035179 [Mya arenaria]